MGETTVQRYRQDSGLGAGLGARGSGPHRDAFGRTDGPTSHPPPACPYAVHPDDGPPPHAPPPTPHPLRWEVRRAVCVGAEGGGVCGFFTRGRGGEAVR